MEREEFDKILIEEGILAKKTREEIWGTRPVNNLSQEKLRYAAKKFRETEPERCGKD